MFDPLVPARRARQRRRTALGHLCPKCLQLWALVAVRNESGFVVECRYCDYQRPVLVPRQLARNS